MKTEFEIAKRKVEDKEFKISQCIEQNKEFFIKSNFDKDNWRKIALKYLQEDFTFALLNREMFEHKATCQRWLEFLREFWNSQLLCSVRNIGGKAIDNMNKKVIDLKNTIKLYSENGI